MYQPFAAPISIYSSRHEIPDKRTVETTSKKRKTKHTKMKINKPKRKEPKEQTGRGKKKRNLNHGSAKSINTSKNNKNDSLKQTFALRNFVSKKK